VPGSLWGRGQVTFLAENIVRIPVKTPLQLAVIGHLHIMLALIAVALTLILSRWFDFRGRLHKIAMPLMIVGTLIITAGVWAVVPFEAVAHMIINIGSFPVLVASWLLVYFGWRKSVRARLAAQEIERPGFGKKLAALLHDPLRFGMLWQMILHLHGDSAGQDHPHVAVARGADRVDRPLAHPGRDHRHHHPAALC
jgi:hypothetical protein